MPQNMTLDDSKRKCEILNCFVREFKKRHPYLSSNQVAQRLDIPQSSLNRIENLATNPSLENVLNILVGTGNEGKISEILGKCFPSHKKRYEQIFSANIDTPMLDMVSSGFATNEETFLIVQMAFTRGGVTREQIQERFGSYGLERLESMVKNGVLVQDDDGIIHADHERVNVTFSDLKKIVCLAVEKCYEPESGHLSYQTEAVNDDGLKLIYRELKRTQVQIRKILYNAEYFGDNKIFVGMVADKMIKNIISDNEESNNGELQ